ncbi:hypothetical protein [Prosthecobacter sp.]|uniref:hypothetical protein n=1 Tax=Prosthecobacter sp. TaxID=1965333 RepID=UPI0037848404
MNTPRLLAALLLACLLLPAARGEEAYTPKAGSSERKAICDGLRAFLIQEYAEKKLPKPIVLKIEYLKVSGEYCFIECVPVFEDGSDAVPEYLPDIGYTHCLKRFNGWHVILDLSRTDVPGAEEIAKIKKSFPGDFPMDLLTEDWRQILAGKYQ